MLRPICTPDDLRVDVARRLRPACASMTTPEFDALVERIVEVEVRFRAREHAAPDDVALPAVVLPHAHDALAVGAGPA